MIDQTDGNTATARLVKAAAAFAASLVLGACGGGSSDGGGAEPPPPPPPPPPVVSKAEAFRFLNQASFGATETAAEEVITLGIEGWIDRQMSLPASLQLPYLRSLPRPVFPGELQPDRVDVWFRHAVGGEDQLRQRVAFALSEIMVVSQLGALEGAPWALADYYDTLSEHAFGNFRDLMEAVTLHPAMGIYLSMLGNEKPNPALNIRPDENYARELMQLFTIGLVELEIDGTVKTDASGQPIPTYDQSVIEGFAHVYTGWHFAGAPGFDQARITAFNQTQPMALYEDYHDTGEKKLLSGVTLPAGQSGGDDLRDALDNIFNHPNVGPFIALRLIERLVTSNPSPAYVRRVAEAFADNGAGVRGDLAGVVRAIFLDPEARPDDTLDTDGKLKEPLLRLTQLWRAYEAESAEGGYPFGFAYVLLGQGPLQSPSVFNFFSPFYAPPGEIRDRGLVAPELQIATEYHNTLITNLMLLQAFVNNSENPDLEPEAVAIDIGEEVGIAADADALVARVAEKLLAGEISPVLAAEVVGMVERIPATDAAARAAEAIYLVATSPEYALQR